MEIGKIHQDSGLQGFVEARPARISDMPCWHEHFLDMWEIIKKAEKAGDDDELLSYQMILKKYHRGYIAGINHWLKEKNTETRFPEDKHAKLKAQNIKGRFEKGLYRYCLCYMVLNRHLIRLRADLEILLKDIPHRKKAKGTKLEIQDNLGFLLQRAYREKEKFVSQRAQLESAGKILNDLAPHFAGLESRLRIYFGKQRGKKAYTAFRARIRQDKLKDAAEIVKSWEKNEKLMNFYKALGGEIQQTAKKILSIYEINHEALKTKDQLVLDTSDLRLMASFITVGEERVDTFIQKYSLPYLDYKFKFLLKQAYRLGCIGNFEKLFTLYEKLLQGVAFPLTDAAAIQLYEGEVLCRAEYIVSSGVGNIPDIFEQVEETALQLEALLKSVRSLYRK